VPLIPPLQEGGTELANVIGLAQREIGIY